MTIHIGAVNTSEDRIKQFGTLFTVGKFGKTCRCGTNQFLTPVKLIFRCKVKPAANDIPFCLTGDQTGNNLPHRQKEGIDLFDIKLAQGAVKHCKICKGIRFSDKIRKTVCRHREVHGNKRCVQIAVVQLHDLVVILLCNLKAVVLQTLIDIFLQMRDIRIRIRISFEKCSKQLLGYSRMLHKERHRVRF